MVNKSLLVKTIIIVVNLDSQKIEKESCEQKRLENEIRKKEKKRNKYMKVEKTVKSEKKRSRIGQRTKVEV